MKKHKAVQYPNPNTNRYGWKLYHKLRSSIKEINSDALEIQYSDSDKELYVQIKITNHIHKDSNEET